MWLLMPMTFSEYGHSCDKYPVDEVGCECFNGMDGLTLEKLTMSFADEMRRKSLEAQSKAAEKARAEEAAEEAKALALEESKRNNCIPELKKMIQQAASNGLREASITGFLLEDFSGSPPSPAKIENLELNSFLEMRSSTLNEYDRMRIAFIKAEPGLSLKLVVETKTDRFESMYHYTTIVYLKVVW
jgi:hypothetical protein